jgi:hypothetical protein
MADGRAQVKPKHRYQGCGKSLTRKDIERYNEELGVWARKHPDGESQYDARDGYSRCL